MILWKRKLSRFLILALVLSFGRGLPALAASPGDVVINEVSWAGSADSSSDEWIELYNNSNQTVDLSGWYIEDDGSTTYQIDSGSIAPFGYFLIEDSEQSVDISGDAIAPLSLANSGDSLILYDETGNIIDTVNGSGGSWYAGSSSSAATMERIDPESSLDAAENWASASAGNGSLGRSGSEILGTPGSVNSNYAGSGPTISVLGPVAVTTGDVFTISVEVSQVDDLNGYGFDLVYDPSYLSFVSATEGPLLNSDGSQTAFSAALKNGVEGTLIIGNSRFNNPLSGISGSGELFSVDFQVLNALGDTSVQLGPESFIAGPVNDIPASLGSTVVEVGNGSIDEITNLEVDLGIERYSLDISWTGIDGAEKYVVERQSPSGAWVELGEVTENSFLDADALTPGVNYNYQVKAVKNGIESAPVAASGVEDRGLVGDLDRSDRVDGRDLLALAAAYGGQLGDGLYDPLVDANYDGVIDGNDLIEIGVNFGLTY